MNQIIQFAGAHWLALLAIAYFAGVLSTPGGLLRLLIAFDVMIFAVLTLGRAKRNETISGAFWTLEQDGKWQGKVFRPVVDWLMSPLEQNHCLVAWYAEHKAYVWSPK